MDTKGIGELVEAKIIAKMLSLGLSVSIPFGNNQRYDIIIDSFGKLEKCQCKSATIRNGCVCFATCSRSGGKNPRSYIGEADYFIVYCISTDKYYKVPVVSVGKGTGYLRVGRPKRTEVGCNIRWAKEFEI